MITLGDTHNGASRYALGCVSPWVLIRSAQHLLGERYIMGSHSLTGPINGALRGKATEPKTSHKPCGYTRFGGENGLKVYTCDGYRPAFFIVSDRELTRDEGDGLEEVDRPASATLSCVEHLPEITAAYARQGLAHTIMNPEFPNPA